FAKTGSGRYSRCLPRPPAARTTTGSSSSNRRWSARGTGGAMPRSTRCGRPVCERSRSSRWPSPRPRGTTTGFCSRTPTGSRNASASRAGGLLEELSQLVSSDRGVGRAYAAGEQVEEAPETHLVEQRRRLDDLRHRLGVRRLQDLAQAPSELASLPAHSHLETHDA